MLRVGKVLFSFVSDIGCDSFLGIDDGGLELADHLRVVSNQAFRHLRLTSDEALEQGDPAREPEDDYR